MKMVVLKSSQENPLLYVDFSCSVFQGFSSSSAQVHAWRRAYACIKYTHWLEVGLLRFPDCFCPSKCFFKVNEIDVSALPSHSVLLPSLYFQGSKSLLFFPNSSAAIGNVVSELVDSVALSKKQLSAIMAGTAPWKSLLVVLTKKQKQTNKPKKNTHTNPQNITLLLSFWLLLNSF